MFLDMFKQRILSFLYLPCRCASITAATKPGSKKKQVDVKSLVKMVKTKDADTKTNNSKDKPKRTPKKSKGVLESVEYYFDNTPHLKAVKNSIPEEYLKSKSSNLLNKLYLADSLVAKEVVDIISPTLYKEPNIIIDNNPGLCLITNELLKKGVPVVRLYESCSKFRKTLQDSVDKHPGRIEVFNKDIFSLWKLSYQDKIDNFNRVGELLKGVPIRNWTDDPAITIIGVMQDMLFLKYMLLSLVTHSDLVSYGRTELYVFMPPKLYQHITASPKDNYYIYRGYSVLFQLLFDFEHLGTFTRKAYVPWESKKSYKYKEAIPNDRENLFLVRVNYKKEFEVPSEHLLYLYHFVRQCMSSRRTKVIAHLEKWVPNAGLKLLLLDIEKKKKYTFSDLTIFTHFGELSSEQFLYLFREFMSWPEVSESPFMASVEDILLKMTTHPDQVAATHITSEPPIEEEIIHEEKKEVEQVDIVKKLVNE